MVEWSRTITRASRQSHAETPRRRYMGCTRPMEPHMTRIIHDTVRVTARSAKKGAMLQESHPIQRNVPYANMNIT